MDSAYPGSTPFEVSILVLVEYPTEFMCVTSFTVTVTFQSLFWWNILLNPCEQFYTRMPAIEFQSLFWWNILLKFWF